jgi:putative flippase GtrA
VITWVLGDWFAGRSLAKQIVRYVSVGVLLVLVAVGTDTIWKWIVGLDLLDRLKISAWLK